MERGAGAAGRLGAGHEKYEKWTLKWFQAEGGRPSWDPLTTLFAVRGASGEGLSDCTDCNGVNRIDAKGGNNAWAPGRASNQSYLLLESGKVAQQAVDSLLCQPRCGLDQAFTRTRTELDGGKNEARRPPRVPTSLLSGPLMPLTRSSSRAVVLPLQ